MKIDQQILERIKDINWFQNCGNQIRLDLPLNVLYAIDWEDTKKHYQTPLWEDTTLEARNILTSFLHSKYRNQFSEWNKISKEARSFIELHIETQLNSFKEKTGLDDTFISLVKWDVLTAIMEHTYRGCKNRPTFFLYLLDIYEMGNFPCGWNGNWPKGDLVIY